MDYRKLVDLARKARRNAYCPYSRFAVGAAVLTTTGKVYTGVNVENASFGLTMCAERTALGRAVSEGERCFAAIAVVAGGKRPVPPCGACLQAIVEFGRDIDVVMAAPRGSHTVTKAGELLPCSFVLAKANK